MQHQCAERKRHAGHRGRKTITSPAMCQEIHPHACEKQVTQTKHAQRPGQRQEHIKQRRRIKGHRVPLRQKREPAIIQRIPKRHFAMPKTLAEVISQRVTENGEVAMKKSPPAGYHVWVSHAQQRREQRRKTPGREELIRRRYNSGFHWFPEHPAR